MHVIWIDDVVNGMVFLCTLCLIWRFFFFGWFYLYVLNNCETHGLIELQRAPFAPWERNYRNLFDLD